LASPAASPSATALKDAMSSACTEAQHNMSQYSMTHRTGIECCLPCWHSRLIESSHGAQVLLCHEEMPHPCGLGRTWPAWLELVTAPTESLILCTETHASCQLVAVAATDIDEAVGRDLVWSRTQTTGMLALLVSLWRTPLVVGQSGDQGNSFMTRACTLPC